MKKRILQIVLSLTGLLLFLKALSVLFTELRAVHFHHLIAQLQDFSWLRLAGAAVLTLLNYLALGGYEWLALRYARHPVRYRQLFSASLVANALGSTFNAAGLSSSAARYRFYTAWGLTAVQTAKVIVFYSVTFVIGLCGITSAALFLHPELLSGSSLPGFLSSPYLPLFLAIPVPAYLILCSVFKNPVRMGHWEFRPPRIKIALTQMALAAFDWLLAAGVLFFLLEFPKGTPFLPFLSLFLLAQIAGLLSQIPAGLGVLEAVIVTTLSGKIPADSLVISLVFYRIIYYLLPLLAATVVLGIHEYRSANSQFKNAVAFAGSRIGRLAPDLIAFSVFSAGAILLFSGATPAEGSRLALLKDFLPLSVLEASHFLGSLSGVALLFLARGLQRRLDGAYLLTLSLLGFGIFFSLLKGIDYEEALVLLLMFSALLPCRRYFHRKASLIAERFTISWTFSILTVLSASVWLGFFAFKHVNYSDDLWWQFSFHGDAPRFLRALVGIFIFALFFALAHLIQVVRPQSHPVTHEDLEKARPIVLQSTNTLSYLALLGDKNLLFNAGRTAFIMYGVQDRSFVSYGNPVGPETEWFELVLAFRNLADCYAGRPVFYQIHTGNLPLYLDAGLTLAKIGEEGRVPLECFSLEGNQRKSLRQTVSRLEKEGATFEILETTAVPAFMDCLRGISDAWLKHKNTKEKGFSLGYFAPEYLKNFPMALVRFNGEIAAFANILASAEKEELSVDLMRYDADKAPQGVMDFLFANLMLWGANQGYQWFDLGMAPLAGLESHAFAPLWNRLGALIATHGEHFYNFQGLKDYKEKFIPVWRPKYIALPGGFSLPRILADIAVLNSGSLKGIFSK